MKQLRILFTCLCAACLVALAPIGIIFGIEVVALCAAAAGVFFLLMLLCKQAQERKEDASLTTFLSTDAEETKNPETDDAATQSDDQEK